MLISAFSPLQVPTELEPWDGKEDVRRASINNFGYGGSNAHVIMEDLDSFTGSRRLQQAANLDNASSRSRRSSSSLEYLPRRRVFVLSGKDERATQAMVSNLKDYLLNTKITDEDGFLDNLAYTLGHRRSRFPWVTSVSADTVEALIKILDSPKAKPAKVAIASPRVGFVYNGQGAQWWAMGRELIEVYPVFKAALLDCNKHLEKLGATWNMIGMFSPFVLEMLGF